MRQLVIDLGYGVAAFIIVTILVWVLREYGGVTVEWPRWVWGV